MSDHVVRAAAYDNTVRAFAADVRDTLGQAMTYHNLNPLSATALGRALAAVAMMREMAKGDNDTITLKIKGDGPMGGLVAVSARDGTLKGYVVNNDYGSYGNDASLGVGPCLMPGFLSVVRDIGLKEPYTGTIALQSGEIGDDLAYYYTYSEQVPSLVALGVKFNSDASVKSAAGMIIQLMPGAAEETIVKIENRLRAAGSVSKLIDKFRTPEAILDYMLPGGNPEITAEKNISYKCGCSRNGMLRGVISLGREELEKITSEQQEIEAVCHFCMAKYRFSSDDVMALLENQ